MYTVNVVVLSGHGVRHFNGDPVLIIPDAKKCQNHEFINCRDLAHYMATYKNTLNILILNFCNNDLPKDVASLIHKMASSKDGE